MYLKKPKANQLFLNAVEEVKASGYTPTPDEVVWLHELAKICVDGFDASCPVYLQQPVTVGNCTLYPKTIGAGLWYEKAAKWYEGDSLAELMCIGFMLAHSRDKETFERLDSKAKTDLAIVRWQLFLSCSCTVEQIAWAINKVLGQHEYANLDSPNEVQKFASVTDWGDIICRLSGHYKQTPEYFIWQCSEGQALDMLAKSVKQDGTDADDMIKKRHVINFFELKRHLKSKAHVSN
jgi:hypothetical protein